MEKPQENRAQTNAASVNSVGIPAKDWSDKVILVVDDIQVNYLLIKAMLLRVKATALWAPDGFKAIEMVESGRKIDAVLMDYNMPQMDGLETTERIKLINPGLPVLSQSTFTDNEDFKRDSAPFDDYLSKPILWNELILKLDSVMK
jgi:two-component system sensor histidine kinase BarA